MEIRSLTLSVSKTIICAFSHVFHVGQEGNSVCTSEVILRVFLVFPVVSEKV